MQGIRHTNGGQTYMEPLEILSLVSCDVNILVICGDKDHMRKHQNEYRQFQAEIGPDAFKRPLLTHRNAITTG